MSLTAHDLARVEFYASRGRRCHYCGDVPETGAIIEHMTPESRGGSSRPENLTVACAPCNTLKSDRTYEEFRKMLEGRLGRAVVFDGEGTVS